MGSNLRGHLVQSLPKAIHAGSRKRKHSAELVGPVSDRTSRTISSLSLEGLGLMCRLYHGSWQVLLVTP